MTNRGKCPYCVVPTGMIAVPVGIKSVPTGIVVIPTGITNKENTKRNINSITAKKEWKSCPRIRSGRFAQLFHFFLMS